MVRPAPLADSEGFVYDSEGGRVVLPLLHYGFRKMNLPATIFNVELYFVGDSTPHIPLLCSLPGGFPFRGNPKIFIYNEASFFTSVHCFSHGFNLLQS